MLCSSNLADKVIDASVLLDWRMSSDHAPIMCNLAVDYLPRLELNKNNLRFNLARADWKLFGQAMDEAIEEMSGEFSSDVSLANRQLTSVISRAAEVSIPKFAPSHAKSYPGHIVDLIKTRRVARKNKKLAKGMKRLT